MDELRLSSSPVLEDLFRTDGLETDPLDIFEGAQSLDDVIAKATAKPVTRTKLSEQALEQLHGTAAERDEVYVQAITAQLSKTSTWGKAALEEEVREIILAAK